MGTRIPSGVISLPTRGGQVRAAALTVAVLDGRAVQYCRVDASVFPVDRSAPNIEMRVAMPVEWNRKTMMYGGGGYNGTIPDVTAKVPMGDPHSIPLARGYAVFASDSGHQADPAFVPSPSLDGSFAVNDEALRNFAAGDALKKTRDAALFILAGAYPVKARYHYFAGGSTGGREALAVAQRWPTAFDGVISVYPAWNNMAEILYLGHLSRKLSQPGAFPGTEQQTLLYNSVMTACDGLDGVKDRVISNVEGCHFNPKRLQCPDGVDPGPTCLSGRQIESVIAMSSPWSWPYKLASGERYYPGFPFLQGADMRTPLLGMGSSAPANPMPKTSGYGMQFWEQWVKYALTRDPSYNSLALNPDRPGEWQRRISYLSTLEDVNNADLRPFLRSGGKLILLHGAADELVSHRSTSDYYHRVVRTVGGQQAAKFMKYYLIPGTNHGPLLPAFNANWDSLSAIERWAESGQAPSRPIVADSQTGRTRPLCDFPAWPRYRAGDVNSAASFVCQK